MVQRFGGFERKHYLCTIKYLFNTKFYNYEGHRDFKGFRFWEKA